MQITIPEYAVVALVGISGSGKSTFAKRHFKATEVLSSDAFRAMVCDDENDQGATRDAFDGLYHIARKRLARKKLTVIDATNIQRDARRSVLQAAKDYHALAVAIVLNVPEELCAERNEARSDRKMGDHVLSNQRSQLRRSLKGLRKEGFRYVYIMNSEEEIANAEIVRTKLWTDRCDESGPFDIVGDIHGCYDELIQLITKLGYGVDESLIETKHSAVNAPDGRKLVFVGDLVDRGPKSPEVVMLVKNIVEHGMGYCVPGNHDAKLVKLLKGKKVQLRHGLEQTAEQLEGKSDEYKAEMAAFLDGLVSHLVFDDGKLVVAHAGMREDYQGRSSGTVRSFALYGETTGEVDEYGFPVRHNWAEEYRGEAAVVYGHVPVVSPAWLNNTICIDTGCVFGGSLTALRYPERELVSVAAKETYFESVRPLEGATDDKNALTEQQAYDDLLSLDELIGKRIIDTKLRPNITIQAEQSAAALETMSRFAVDPKWLIYLPPTMSPCETSQDSEFLEHPAEALNYYRKNGVSQVICEEKHMGSRAVIVLCRTADAARERFGVLTGEQGKVYTRYGRSFFNDPALEHAFLARLADAFSQAAFWQEHDTDWVCLDAEIMPWSIKGLELIKEQYGGVGAAASRYLQDAIAALSGVDDEVCQALQAKYQTKQQLISRFRQAYGRYCWPFEGLDDIKVAPFHILATQSSCHIADDHQWHMSHIAKVCSHDPGFLHATTCKVAQLDNAAECESVINWWLSLTEQGGEGMVVKPMAFVSHGPKGLIQPAVKCRGREYLRIIYGPEYTESENLSRLKFRKLNKKRSLALREFALGSEALSRFVQREPLRRVHECVFGVMALESETTDPRL